MLIRSTHHFDNLLKLTAEHYEWEETILDEVGHAEWEGMKRSFCFGAGCGLLGFGMLRWRRGGGAGGLSRYASSSSSASSRTSGGGYKFDPVPSRSNNGSNMHHQHPHHQYNSNNNTGSGFLLDTALSTIIGMGTSLLAIESDLFFPPQQLPTVAAMAKSKSSRRRSGSLLPSRWSPADLSWPTHSAVP